METKRCSKCKEVKSVGEFSRASREKSGLKSSCRSCNSDYNKKYYRKNPEKAASRRRKWQVYNPEKVRASRLSQKYGITVAQYEVELERQGGVCEICGEPCSSGRRLAIDHDHSCCPGRKSCRKCLRGLLCGNCNLLLGKAKDSIELLEAAIKYLQSHTTRLAKAAGAN